MNAAEEIVGKAIVTAPPSEVTKLRGDRFTSPNDWIRPLESHLLGLYREGEGVTEFQFPRKGEYTFRIRAFGEQAGWEPPKLAFRVGGKDLQIFEVKGTERGIFEVKATLEAGPQKVAVAFLNNYSDETNPNPKLRGDRNLFVDYVEIVAPPDASSDAAPRESSTADPAPPRAGS